MKKKWLVATFLLFALMTLVSCGETTEQKLIKNNFDLIKDSFMDEGVVFELRGFSGCGGEMFCKFINDHTFTLIFDEEFIDDHNELPGKTLDTESGLYSVTYDLEDGEYCSMLMTIANSLKTSRESVNNFSLGDIVIYDDLNPTRYALYGNGTPGSFGIINGDKMRFGEELFAPIPEQLRGTFGGEEFANEISRYNEICDSLDKTPYSFIEGSALQRFTSFDPDLCFTIDIDDNTTNRGTASSVYSNYIFKSYYYNDDIHAMSYDFENDVRMEYKGSTDYLIKYTGVNDEDWYDSTLGIFDLFKAAKEASVSTGRNQYDNNRKAYILTGDFSFLKKLDVIGDDSNTSTFFCYTDYQGKDYLQNEDIRIRIDGVRELTEDDRVSKFTENAIVSADLESLLNFYKDSFEIDYSQSGLLISKKDGVVRFGESVLKPVYNQYDEIEAALLMCYGEGVYSIPYEYSALKEAMDCNFDEFLNPSNYHLSNGNYTFSSDKRIGGALSGIELKDAPVYVDFVTRSKELPEIKIQYGSNEDQYFTIKYENYSYASEFDGEEIKDVPTLSTYIEYIESFDEYEISTTVYNREYHYATQADYIHETGKESLFYNGVTWLTENGNTYYILDGNNFGKYYMDAYEKLYDVIVSKDQLLEYLRSLTFKRYKGINLIAVDKDNVESEFYVGYDGLSIAMYEGFAKIGDYEISSFLIDSVDRSYSIEDRTKVPTFSEVLRTLIDDEHSFDILDDRGGNTNIIHKLANGYQVSDYDYYIATDSGYSHEVWDRSDHQWSKEPVINLPGSIGPIDKEMIEQIISQKHQVIPSIFENDNEVYFYVSDDSYSVELSYNYTNGDIFLKIKDSNTYATYHEYKITNVSSRAIMSLYKDHVIDNIFDRMKIEKLYAIAQTATDVLYPPVPMQSSITTTRETKYAFSVDKAFEYKDIYSQDGAFKSRTHTIARIDPDTGIINAASYNFNSSSWNYGTLSEAKFKEITSDIVLSSPLYKEVFNSSIYELKEGSTDTYVLKSGERILVSELELDGEKLPIYSSNVEFKVKSNGEATITIKDGEYRIDNGTGEKGYLLCEMNVSISIQFDSVLVVLP